MVNNFRGKQPRLQDFGLNQNLARFKENQLRNQQSEANLMPDINSVQEQILFESLILAQDERWRRA